VSVFFRLVFYHFLVHC